MANRIAKCRQVVHWFLFESGLDKEQAEAGALPYLQEKLSLERDEVLGE